MSWSSVSETSAGQVPRAAAAQLQGALGFTFTILTIPTYYLNFYSPDMFVSINPFVR